MVLLELWIFSVDDWYSARLCLSIWIFLSKQVFHRRSAMSTDWKEHFINTMDLTGTSECRESCEILSLCIVTFGCCWLFVWISKIYVYDQTRKWTISKSIDLLFVLLPVDDRNIVVGMVVDRLLVRDKLSVDKWVVVIVEYRVHLDREWSVRKSLEEEFVEEMNEVILWLIQLISIHYAIEVFD